MKSFLKKLFLQTTSDNPIKSHTEEKRYTGRSRDIAFEDIKGTMFETVEPSTGEITWTSAEPPHFPIPRYYNSFGEIYNLKKQGKFDEAFDVAWNALLLVPEVARSSAEKYGGKWGVSSIPPLEYVIDYLIMKRDIPKLKEVKDILKEPEELRDFQDMVVFALERIGIFTKILDQLKAHPGSVQNSLGKSLDINGRVAASLVSQAERYGMIQRIPHKSTYQLFLNP
jgi:hypothetical protein